MFTIPSLPFTFPYFFSEISWRHCYANPQPRTFRFMVGDANHYSIAMHPTPMYFLRCRNFAIADRMKYVCLWMVWCVFTVSQKNCTILFCNNFVKLSSILVIFGTCVYSSKFVTRRYQNRKSLLNNVFIIPCETSLRSRVISNVSYVT